MRLPEELARLGIPQSTEELRAYSGGEVISPELLDWSATAESGELVPVPGGLFCPEIFGPDGERFGHVELASPVMLDGEEMVAVAVLPPAARRIRRLEGSRVAISRWNDLYRRLIHRNNRLKALRALPGVPTDVVTREEALLGEAVRKLWAGDFVSAR